MAVKRRDAEPGTDAAPEAVATGAQDAGAAPADAADDEDADEDGGVPTPAEAGEESAAIVADAEGEAAEPAERRPRGRPAPLWILAVYLLGLVAVFLGERVLASLGTVSTAVTVLGVACVIVSMTLRYSPRFRVGGQRKQIETWLGALSVTGLVGVVVYFVTTDWLAQKLGLFSLGDETFDRVMGVLTVLWVGLVVVSVVPMVFAETAAYPMRHAVRPESRRVRFAALAGMSLAAALVYSALFVYAAQGLDWEADYSYFKTSEPSESTRKVAETLEEPVLVQAFFPDVNEVRNEVERYLENLARTSPKLKVEIKDRLAEPKLARDLRITEDGTIVLTLGESHEQLRLGSDIETARPKLRKLDGDFQQRLLKLVRSQRTAYLTVGHGEINDTRGMAKVEAREASVVKELLKMQNFTVKDLGLAQGLGSAVPDDADLVLVMGPSEPLAPEEIATLKRYAEGGGRLFVALDPDAETASEGLLPSQLRGLGGGAEPGADDEFDPEVDDAAALPSATPAGAAAASASASAVASATPRPPASARPTASATPAAKASAAPAAKASATPAAKASATPAAKASATPAASGQPAIAGSASPPGSAPAAGSGAPPADGFDPNVELAAALGLTYSGRVLANDRMHMKLRYNPSDRVRIATNRFSSHASVSTLSRNAAKGAGVVFDGASSLDKLPGSKSKVDFAVRAMPDTFQDLDRNFRFDAGTEKRDSFNIAAAVTAPAVGGKAKPKPKEPPKDEGKDAGKKDPKDAAPAEMRAFVIGDAAAFTDLPMSRFLGNQLLFVDAVRWLAGEESIMGEISNEEDLRIEHTKQEDLVWFYSTIFGAPALVLGLGLWLGRRPARQAKAAKKGGKS